MTTDPTTGTFGGDRRFGAISDDERPGVRARRYSICWAEVQGFLKLPRTVVHRRPDVALRAQVLAAVVLRKNGHSVSMGKNHKESAVFEWVRLTLKS